MPAIVWPLAQPRTYCYRRRQRRQRVISHFAVDEPCRHALEANQKNDDRARIQESPGGTPAHPNIKSLIFSKLSPDTKCLWDVGGGTGQISIEWQKSHPDCRVYAIERDGACIQTRKTGRLERDEAACVRGLNKALLAGGTRHRRRVP